MSDLKRFIDTLARTKAPRDAVNPWDYSCEENKVRRENLLLYLKAMQERTPDVLLVSEAPGYRGCRRTGVPFCSERLILSHPFFKEGFAVAEPEAMAEVSATVVWRTFDALNFYPLMWPAYPFHPHQPGNPHSNRTPRPEETTLGKVFLTNLIEQFQIRRVIGVGRIAERTLREMGYAADAVRHPAHGGAPLFRRGLQTLINS